MSYSNHPSAIVHSELEAGERTCYLFLQSLMMSGVDQATKINKHLEASKGKSEPWDSQQRNGAGIEVLAGCTESELYFYLV